MYASIRNKGPVMQIRHMAVSPPSSAMYFHSVPNGILILSPVALDPEHHNPKINVQTSDLITHMEHLDILRDEYYMRNLRSKYITVP